MPLIETDDVERLVGPRQLEHRSDAYVGLGQPQLREVDQRFGGVDARDLGTHRRSAPCHAGCATGDVEQSHPWPDIETGKHRGDGSTE